MDHYNEQLVTKFTQPADVVKRVMIALGMLAVIFITTFAMIAFGFPFLILIAIGACYLAYYLFTNTFVEYEYIVTNNDMDIDKIEGRRKRKRLITVKLDTVTEWGEFDGEVKGADATVIASDATGQHDWYIMANHDKYGRVAVIFSPIEETLININFGVPYAQKKKDLTSAGRQRDQEEAEEMQNTENRE